jgi:hypothetical protein
VLALPESARSSSSTTAAATALDALKAVQRGDPPSTSWN